MSWRQQAPRPIQCRSCTGSVPLRCVLRPSRLPERNRHAGDFWRPKACLMTGWGQGKPASSRIRRDTSCQRCVSHTSCSRPFVGCHRMRTCVHCKPRNHGRATRQRMSRHAFWQRIHTSIQKNSSLAPRRCTRLLPIHIHGRPGTRVRVCHACALPMTQAHAHYRSSTLTLKLRHFSARREASTLLDFSIPVTRISYYSLSIVPSQLGSISNRVFFDSGGIGRSVLGYYWGVRLGQVGAPSPPPECPQSTPRVPREYPESTPRVPPLSHGDSGS
jgi:hypothetical protein